MKEVFLKAKKIWKLAKDFKLTGDIGVIVVSIMILIRGFSLILYSIFSGESILIERFPAAEKFKIGCIMFMMSIFIGISLIVLSMEIFLRLKKSYRITQTFLFFNLILFLLLGLDYVDIILIILSSLLLRIIKGHLYREWASFRKRKYGILIILSFIFILMYMMAAPFLQESFLADGIIGKSLFKKGRSFLGAGLLVYFITWTFLIFRNLIVFRDRLKNKVSKEELIKVEEFLKKNKGDVNTHLMFLGDKALFWGMEGKVLIQYAKIGDSLVALGDPLGDEKYIVEAIEEFQDFANKFTLSTAFYRIDRDKLAQYHENGYHFYKLGEEAVVPLENFDLKGKKKQSLRTAKNKFERDNYSFEMIYPPYSDEFLNELEDISVQWLNGRREDKFSIGWFQKEYLNRSSIGVVREQEGKIIAFASTVPYYDEKETISIDLMRFKKDSPNGMMDLLFLHLILWAKEEGYNNFSLGMAPLANVGVADHCHTGEKFAKFIFNYGNHWYNFKGLRYFKGKFEPNWIPRFLAYQKVISLPLLALSINRHIGKGNK